MKGRVDKLPPKISRNMKLDQSASFGALLTERCAATQMHLIVRDLLCQSINSPARVRTTVDIARLCRFGGKRKKRKKGISRVRFSTIEPSREVPTNLSASRPTAKQGVECLASRHDTRHLANCLPISPG